MNKTLLTTQLVILVLVVLLVLYTIYYIRELKSCECFKINDKNQTNLNFLEFYEYLELFSVIVIMFGIVTLMPSKKSKGKGMTNVLLMFAMLIVYMVIKYNLLVNVYKLSKGIKEGCECSDKWQRFFLYYQGIVSGIEILQYVVVFLLAAVVSLSALLK